ncbi:ATP-binding protein [Neobacillus niacini]|uniref:ATP-binding protein n=1 Tax=Neobacillus niacini TaxID=86668 RepID=UPI00052F5340|nr:ATP-binding protein [Neobacillus niacini]KGM44619.1 sporulation kinase [Neobacillus niacini]MEC1522366.1 ATP-binding protein [Neobacillus niacini]
MKEDNIVHKLFYEETKATNLFLWLFYIFYIAFELIYYYLFPNLYRDGGISKYKEGLGIWYYFFIFGLFPLAIYYFKKGNPYIIKYLYIYTFIVIDTVHNLIIYLGTDKQFAAGSIVEVVFILFSPIFVNKKYYWTVSLGMVLKYGLIGFIIHDVQVVAPMIIYMILSAIALIILIRFKSYLHSLTKAHEELRRKEKLAVIGQMAAAIAHEIRNPLSSLKGFTQLQQERYPNTNDFYPIMIQEIDRINSIVEDLMTLGKPKEIKFSKASIEEIIAYTLSITQQEAERQGVSVETTMTGPLPPLDCDSKQLKQVFINLIKNAIESMSEGGKVKVNVKVLDGTKMNISIQDEGSGIDEESIPNLGEPFFTTKADGTGLGLMVSNQIIQDHQGKITIKSSLGKGTTVNVMLPISQIYRKN